jgi:signal transduction histidine kinase
MPPWLDRIAHDLRGPLMPLQTAAYLLRSGQLDPVRQAELVDVIDRQTRQLSRMIEELGDWLRASQQRLIADAVRGALDALGTPGRRGLIAI